MDFMHVLFQVRPSRTGCRWHREVLAAMFCVALCAGAVRAGDVVIVLSGDAAPYGQAELGLKKQFADQNRTTRTVTLQDVSNNGMDATIGPNADLVVAVGTSAAKWLHGKVPAATPLVYCMVADPGALGLGDGRATYGVSTDVPLKAQFALIEEALPAARTLGILYRANAPEGQRLLQNVQEALPKNWQLKAVAVDGENSIADAIEALMKQHVDVVWTVADPAIYDTAAARALLLASLRTNTPVFGFSSAFVRAGALLGVGVDPKAQGQQAAALGLKLLDKDAAPPTEHIYSPANHQIAVNLIVASQIHIELPKSLVQRAANVYKEGG